jgi:hypothetical protein
MNLLKEIDSKDIDMLINDLELENEGYVINFIIDPYDIFRFTFPYGIKNEDLGNRPLDDVGDEAVGYSHIFDNYKPIILDEYRLELYFNRDNIKRNIKEAFDCGINHNNIFDILEDKLASSNQKTIDNLYKELEESYTFLLSTVVLTKPFVKHFDDIFIEKLQIDKFELSRVAAKFDEQLLRIDDSIILKTFSENKRSSWSATYYKEWVKSKNNDAYFKRLPPREISRQLANTYRDFVVIDRVCRINKNLQESDKLSGKYLFLYFSSANKSKDLFSTPSVQKHFPVINGESFNILRSVKHAYLLFLFSNPDIKETIRLLKKLKIIAELSENSSLGGLSNSKFEDSIKELSGFREKGKDFERINVERSYVRIQVHHNYQEQLKLKIEELKIKKSNPTDLRKLYEEMLDNAKSNADSIDPMDRMQATYSTQSNLDDLIKKLIENKTLNLHTGEDIIVGSYQHLPILLFLNNKINNQLSDLFKLTVDFTVKSARIRDESLKQYIKAVGSLYAQSEKLYSARNASDRDDFYYASVLVESFISLILPYDGNSITQENELYELLHGIYNQKISLGKLNENESPVNYKRVYKKWRDDFYYFLIWSSRRRNEITESLKFANYAIEFNPNEPRFYHGKSLALYNWYVVKDSLSVRDSAILKSLLESTEKAIELYKTKLSVTKDEKIKFYLKSSIIALQNTIIYSVSLHLLPILENKAGLGDSKLQSLNDEYKSEYNLLKLRSILDNEIKTFLIQGNQKVKDIPELSHTESVLELCEAIDFYNNKNYADFISKLIEAKKAIESSLKIEKNNKLYQTTEQKIHKWEKEWENIVKRIPQTQRNKITKLVTSK